MNLPIYGSCTIHSLFSTFVRLNMYVSNLGPSFCISKINWKIAAFFKPLIYHSFYCCKRGGGQFLAEQLTLSQPGDKLCPPQYYARPLPDFQTLRRPCTGNILCTLELTLSQLKTFLHPLLVFTHLVSALNTFI